ncbi:hypothetical protein C8R48DRAFT_679757 [Suillus tomentosus]|nr:hypothetical protein C8R48DRAFT_679757 [Suillus tomentosus]
MPASLPAATPARWSAASLPPWNPPGPPISGTTNDRRLSHHGQGVSQSPLSVIPTIQRHQAERSANAVASSSRHPTSRNSRSTSVTQRRRETTKYLVVLHPEPMHGTVHTEYEHMFREIRAPIPQKIASFILQARNFGLVFEIEDSFQKDNPAGPVFHQSLCSHFERVGLAFSGSDSHPLPSSSSLPTPMTQFPWSFLLTGKGQRSTRGAKLLPARSSPEHLTHNDIQKNGSRLPVPSAPYHDHTLVFILPLWDIIAGPIDGHGMHCCLAPRLWNGHFESSLREELEEIQCSTICITQPVQAAAAIQTCQLNLLDALTNSGISSTPTALASTSQPRRPSVTLSGSSLSASTSSVSSTSSASSSSESSSSPFAPTPPAVSVSSSPLFSSASLLTSETTPRSPHVALRQWRNRLEHDLQLRRAVAGQEDHVIHITAPNAQKAAESFLVLCKVWCLEGSDSQLVFPDDTEITNATPLNLIIGSIDATIGYGVGDGPMRSFWGALIAMITQHSGHWQLMSEGYYMPTVTSLPPCDEDIISFRAYSLIIRTGFILGMELLPISPHLLVYLLDGYEVSIAQPFLDATSPMTSQRLRSWPPPSVISPSGCRELSIAPACDPYSLILEVDGTIQINQLRYLSEAAQTDLGQRLICHMVFGNETPLAHRLHTVYSALKSAFQYVIHDNMKFCDPILQEMFAGRILISPQQVIDIICPEPITSYSLPLRQGYNPNLDYVTLAGQFMVHLKRYLRGRGTPHAADGSVLFEEDSSSDDVVYRSRLFLRSATAHEVLPVDATQCIKIKFDTYWEHSWGRTVGIHTHTCFYKLDVLLDEATASIISQAIPEDDFQTTDFDWWIHSNIGENSSNSYNQV